MGMVGNTQENTYVFISHDLSVVQHLADEILVMYLGKIVEYGDSQAIFKDPKHPYLNKWMEIADRSEKDRFDLAAGLQLATEIYMKEIFGAILDKTENVKNCQSPEWLQSRLKAIGLRPISALVDITNYITND